jgi:hypothetical protein
MRVGVGWRARLRPWRLRRRGAGHHRHATALAQYHHNDRRNDQYSYS